MSRMILWSSLSLVCLNRYFVRTRGKVTLIMHHSAAIFWISKIVFEKIIATSTFLLRFSLFKVAGLMQSGKQQLLSLLSLIFGLSQSLWQNIPILSITPLTRTSWHKNSKAGFEAVRPNCYSLWPFKTRKMFPRGKIILPK